MDNMNDLAIASEIKSWQGGMAQSVTLIVTEDCQLRCGYCYMTGKNIFNKMSFSVAKAAVDYVLRERDLFTPKSVIWDFIGGEPLLEIDLIDKICDYIKLQMYQINHPWFNSYRFSLSTNGLLYDSDKVQRFIRKNRRHLSFSISIDGTKQKHDAQRVFPNGQGSYDKVVKNISLWLQQFPVASTKATIAHDDLPYIKDSVVHMWELGIKDVAINPVFEDVWQTGDDIIYEQQLMQLADYILEHELYNNYKCALFSQSIGEPLLSNDDNNWCGTGKMLAVGCDGTFYPCVRFAQYSLNNKIERPIGNCFDGIEKRKLRPFLALTRKAQSSATCLECDVASGCAWCPGCNYDMADSDTLFQRAVKICDLHKARVRANKYFWAKLQDKLKDQSQEFAVRG